MADNSEMVKALREHVVPVLRQRGFRGSLPHFRRFTPAWTDLLTFQFARHGGGFVIEIAQCDRQGITMPWGEFIPPNKVNAHHVYSPRPRLGSRPGGTDHWFRYDDGTPPDKLAHKVLAYLDEADAWLSVPKNPQRHTGSEDK